MWNAKKSILLSKICVLCFMAGIVLLAILTPRLVRYLFFMVPLKGKEILFYCTLYGGCIPALALLWDLLCLLRRISKGEIFVQQNVTGLRRISWYCLLGGLICFLSGAYYLPFLLIAFAAVFVGLIVRVVKNVFAQALLLQQEVDGTI